MINSDKCVEFNKFLNYYKKKTHLSFYDYQNILMVSLNNFESQTPSSQFTGNLSSLYTDWQKKHDVTQQINCIPKSGDKFKLDDKTEKKFVSIDFSMNSISDLINIAEKNIVQPNTEYNINLKMIHTIKPELCCLDSMVGMQGFKKSILDQLLYYIQGFHTDGTDYKHTVIIGSPGTGKTEIAKILGKIYSKIGVINKPNDSSFAENCAFKKVTRSDLIAGYVGQTAIKTKGVITKSLGGVLFIDEAYSLGDDSFSKECVDTLCESLSDQKDNIMVIIAGYETELNEQFFKLNSGLESRFVWRFKIDDYGATDLWEIFKKKVSDCNWKLGKINGEPWFKKKYDNFSGFGRDIETFLFKVKIAHSKRVYGKMDSEKKMIELTDMDIGYDIFMKSKENTREHSLKKSQKIISSMFV
jgi:hypothetical protein